jgi:hypothetical protein
VDLQWAQVRDGCCVLDSEVALTEQSFHGIDHDRHHLAMMLDRGIIQPSGKQRLVD